MADVLGLFSGGLVGPFLFLLFGAWGWGVGAHQTPLPIPVLPRSKGRISNPRRKKGASCCLGSFHWRRTHPPTYPPRATPYPPILHPFVRKCPNVVVACVGLFGVAATANRVAWAPSLHYCSSPLSQVLARHPEAHIPTKASEHKAPESSKNTNPYTKKRNAESKSPRKKKTREATKDKQLLRGSVPFAGKGGSQRKTKPAGPTGHEKFMVETGY